MNKRSRPLVIAHRGSCHAFPENTHAAFDAAVRAGVDAMELDVQLSRDGVPVAYHDDTLRMIDGSRDRIASLTLDELRDRDFGGWFRPRFRGERIPTLSEILDRYPSKLELMLELKVPRDDIRRRARLARAVVDAVAEHGAEDRVFILSFDRNALLAARRRAPDLRYVLNMDTRPYRETLRSVLRPFSALCLPGRHVSGRLADAVHGLDRQLFTYRCDRERVAARALRAGVDGLMADDALWLARFVRRVDRSSGRP